jgi:hypothetical protein
VHTALHVPSRAINSETPKPRVAIYTPQRSGIAARAHDDSASKQVMQGAQPGSVQWDPPHRHGQWPTVRAPARARWIAATTARRLLSEIVHTSCVQIDNAHCWRKSAVVAPAVVVLQSPTGQHVCVR